MKIFPLLCLFFLMACAGSPAPELKTYLLRSVVENQFSKNSPTAKIGIGTLTMAPYIDQSGIVLEKSDRSFSSARFHQWAEPLRESLRVFLANEIATAAGQPIRARHFSETRGYTIKLIDIRIEQLHGTASGEAKLVAYWAHLDPIARQVLSEHEFADTEKLTTDGYGALVDAEMRLFIRLAKKIAKTL